MKRMFRLRIFPAIWGVSKRILMVKNKLMLEVKDLCIAYLEGYIQCKVSEYLLHDKVLSSDLDMIKEKAVKCMEQYISQQEISEVDKEEMKQKHKQWAEKVLQGIKQRLHECGKIE